MTKKIIRWVGIRLHPVLLVSLYFLFLVDFKQDTPVWKIKIPYLDKYLHFFFFFLFSSSAVIISHKWFDLEQKRKMLFYLLIILLYSTIFIFLIEILQELLTNTRKNEILDIVAGLLGVLGSLLIHNRIVKFFP